MPHPHQQACEPASPDRSTCGPQGGFYGQTPVGFLGVRTPAFALSPIAALAGCLEIPLLAMCQDCLYASLVPPPLNPFSPLDFFYIFVESITGLNVMLERG